MRETTIVKFTTLDDWSKSDSAILGALKVAYIGTFPFDGYDPINHEEGYRKGTPHDYMFHPLTIITSFLGISNRDLNNSGKQSFGNIFKNIIGWEDDVSTNRKIFNLVKMIPIIGWHIIKAAIRFTTNIIKLFTEFLPTVMSNYTYALAYKVYNQIHEHPQQIIWQAMLSMIYIALRSASLLCEGVFIIGRAITSPHKSVRAGWHRGLVLGGSSWQGRALGAVLATLSIALTVLIYALVLPIAAKYTVVLVVPHLPAAALVVVNHIADSILPTLDAIGNIAFMPIVQPAFHLLGVTVSPAIVALSVIAGTTITTLGTATSKMINNIKDWWFGSKKEVLPEIKETITRSTHSISESIRSSTPVNIPKKAYSKVTSAPLDRVRLNEHTSSDRLFGGQTSGRLSSSKSPATPALSKTNLPRDRRHIGFVK